MKALFFSLLHLLFLPGYESLCFSQKSTNALATYINKKDGFYRWNISQTTTTADGSFYELNLVSQSWHKIKWRHRLTVYIPQKAKSLNTLLLVLRHIYSKNADFNGVKIISDSTGTASAILYDIPNQPLFGGKEEDDLQAYTFSKYLTSGDETWPLLFPMVKSVVRAMDAIQELARKESKVIINKFIITGHSKRGHATWLTAAVDSRVKGIIPIAIDVLNSTAQLPHHLEAFGKYSTPSNAATDLLRSLDSYRGKRLIEMVDAYSYKDQLKIPKLIVSATNDPFFTTDALNLYWDGLTGPKWVLYLPNATHVSAYSDLRINRTAFALVRSIAMNKILPQFMYKFEQVEEGMILKITTDSSATKAYIWIINSLNKDFRQSKWISKPMQQIKLAIPESGGNYPSAKTFEMLIQPPLHGFKTVFGEIEFMKDSFTFSLSTQTHLISNK